MEERFRVKSHGPYWSLTNGSTPYREHNRNWETQRILTQDNLWWYVINKDKYRGKFDWKDAGGPFQSEKFTLELDSWEPTRVYRDTGSTIYDSTQMLYPSHEFADLANSWENHETTSKTARYRLSQAAPDPISDSYLDSFGATAISRCRPANPVFDGATTVAELLSERKFFSLPGRAGSPAGEYLNYQLGIAPSVSALQDLAKAAKTSEEVLQQLERDSGKRIRRRYTFPEEVHTTSVRSSMEGLTAPFDLFSRISMPSTGAFQEIVTKKTTKTWFSGAFTYYLPKGGWRRKLAELEALYGVKPGVDTLWELVPLSFVADYFFNIGDVLQNMNTFASDGLVMPYGYVMQTQKVEKDIALHWTLYINNTPVKRTIRGKITTVTLQRRRANPFGFGIADNNLSLRQLSILAALGLSRK